MAKEIFKKSVSYLVNEFRIEEENSKMCGSIEYCIWNWDSDFKKKRLMKITGIWDIEMDDNGNN